MNHKLTVTAVTYLNTKPFLYGIVKSGFDAQIQLELDIPSQCAKKLASGAAQIGLIPVAAIPELNNAQIISDYCIGTLNEVKTVCLYSDYPIEALTHLYLDFHSRTSVELTKILLREYWGVTPKLLPAGSDYIQKIGGSVGGLIIGDRTIGLEDKYPFVYDLGAAWHDLTGLPFVFAAWVSTVPLSDTFIQQFNQALQLGLDSIPQLLYLLQSPDPNFSLDRYFNQYISYTFNEKKREALQLFLSKIAVNALTKPTSKMMV
ncbi:MAG: menaquinone biosynthesis protein [Saprospiraceae bacterium]|nr:menaquinone biosynthesis protein [Saprospiraceae bacterium]